MNARRNPFFALLVALALGAAACGASDEAADSSSVGADGSAQAATDDDRSLLDISAVAADGSTIDLSDYAGQDLMLWFWAPW